MNNNENIIKEIKLIIDEVGVIEKDSNIIMEKVSPNYIEDVIRLATDVFTNEQNIPANLVPLNEDLQPIWWCARIDEVIIGISASWRENDEWHWGRYAVDKSLRGKGIGKKLAMFSLNEIFNLGVEEIYSEARDITVKMLGKLGCEVTGEPVNFYGDSVTPIIIKKSDFIQAKNRIC